MTTYLTGMAIFRCSSNPGIAFRCSDNGQRKVSYRGQTVLTRNAKLSPLTSPPMPCPILTALAQGTPTFCKGQFSPWLPGGVSFTTLAGEALLTSDASCKCLSCPGQTIGLLIDFGNSPGFLYKGSAVQITQPQALSLLAAVETPAIPEWKPFVPQEPPAAMAAAASKGQDQGAAVATTKPGQAKAAGNGTEAEEEEDRLEYKCGTCAKKCDLKEKYKDKTPPWEDAPLDLGSDSIALRKNYKLYLGCQYCAQECANAKHKEAPNGEQKTKPTTKADLRYCRLDKTVFHFQAHHLISGRQVFQPLQKDAPSPCKNENILRMAHVCGYDVNRAQNCIMLVSDQDDDEEKGPELKRKLDEKTAQESKKALNSFEAMQEGKLQWHMGNHSYTFDQEALKKLKARIKFYTKKQDAVIKTYAELLSNKLDIIHQSLEKQVIIARQPICPRDFIERMDYLSKEIRKYLEAFEDGYHLSYPYYVSKAAYNFAFQLPQTFTVMTIQRKSEGILAKKFRISRKVNQVEGEDNISVFSVEGMDPDKYEGQMFSEPLDREEFTRFCANLEYFIFFGQTGPATLPFSIAPAQVSKVSPGNEDAGAYVRSHAYDLIVWIMGNPVKYKAINARVKERLGIAKGN